MNTGVVFFLTIATAALSGCGNYTRLKNDRQEAGQKLDAAPLTFATVSAQIFEPKCVSCHSKYRSYETVVEEVSRITQSIESNRMPKNAEPLAQNLKDLLRTWIDAGTPEFENDEQPEPPPESPVALEPNYQSIKAIILEQKCTMCHSPSGQAKFLDLSSRKAIWDGRARLLNFDNPESSPLIAAIRDAEEPMPPTWSNIAPLTESQVAVMIEWIRQGVP